MKKNLKKDLEKWIKIDGKMRGGFVVDYVLKKEGEEGLKKLKKRSEELKYDIPYGEAKATEWFPLGLNIVSHLLEVDTFNWSDEELRESGRDGAKTSFIVKLLMKFFVSLEKFVEKIPHYWEMYFTVGKLEVVNLDEKNRKLTLHLRGVRFPPSFLIVLEGFFQQMFEFVLGKGNVKESKFTIKENYYEYYAKW